MSYHIRHTIRINEVCDGYWTESYRTKRELNKTARLYSNEDGYNVEIGVGIYAQDDVELIWICDCATMQIAKTLLKFLNKE